MNNDEIIAKYIELHNIYRATPQVSILIKAEKLVATGKLQAAYKLLSKLPDRQALLVELAKKLKNKSVYTTIKKILSDASISKIYQLKGLSSLMTHMAIEIEGGRLEYTSILKDMNIQYQQVLNAL